MGTGVAKHQADPLRFGSKVEETMTHTKDTFPYLILKGIIAKTERGRREKQE